MAEDNFITHPAKVKVVVAIANVSLANAEVGELFYDSTANRLYIRLSSGWKYVAFT